ncbi:Monothiol glutaredoxin-S14, chloroplastic [Ananas comosus]|uniref:Monothiol glutaredoxin-S14, chloroplastic n=1 Tax=Ananas comosus TaxID=4615 RepID=A0A199VT99_ANACO|nr:Monothiol glutaredoxin-S14, chloroplastic [Ananas comosus]
MASLSMASLSLVKCSLPSSSPHSSRASNRVRGVALPPTSSSSSSSSSSASSSSSSSVSFLDRPRGSGGFALFDHARRRFRAPAKGAAPSSSFRCFSALTPELKSTLDKVVQSHKVVLFMKGTKDFPQCGFSNTVVQILKLLNVPFETLNILENEMLRQGLKEYSNWPTFPQLYIDGEFFGGCDITVEAYKSGELQEILEKTMCS